MVNSLKYLKWDSQFWGIKIGKIQFSPYNTQLLTDKLKIAVKRNYRLVYVFADNPVIISEEILKKYKGSQIDNKVTFSKSRLIAKSGNHYKEIIDLKLENPGFNMEDLYSLAFQSGDFSRFNTDKSFGKDNFQKLYKSWVENSLYKPFASHFFAYFIRKKAVGMITLNIDNSESIAKIGLFATDSSFRGKGIGTKLLEKVEQIAIEQSIENVLVDTQANNLLACQFYEKAGYSCLGSQQIYHFWL